MHGALRLVFSVSLMRGWRGCKRRSREKRVLGGVPSEGNSVGVYLVSVSIPLNLDIGLTVTACCRCFRSFIIQLSFEFVIHGMYRGLRSSVHYAYRAVAEVLDIMVVKLFG